MREGDRGNAHDEQKQLDVVLHLFNEERKKKND
jgi:hypothetical protein